MKNTKSILLILVLFVIVFCSCKKDNDCPGKCKKIKVKGRAFNAITNTGISGINITVSWYLASNTGCYLCVLDQSATTVGKTDQNGHFEIPISINPSLNSYEIRVSPDQVVGYYPNSPIWANPQKPETYQNIEIKYLQKTTLKINFHRNQTDSFLLFYTGFSVKNNNPGIDSLIFSNNFFSRNMQQSFSDTSITLLTVANLYTKISKNKKRNVSVTNTTYDSIICIPNYNNEITINY